METIPLRRFQDIYMSMWAEVDTSDLSKKPYDIHPIRKMWHQMFPPPIYRLCQEIALDGRYVDYNGLLDVKADKMQIMSIISSTDYLGREEFLKKVQNMGHSRVAHTEIIKIPKFSTGLICWACSKAHPWSSVLHLTCYLVMVY
jgi:hypothetical protein